MRVLFWPGAAALLFTAVASVPSIAQSTQHAVEGESATKDVVSHIYEPKALPATDANIAELKVPDGFKITKFADGLRNARIIVVAKDGDVYVTRREQADVLMLKDTDGDGKADVQTVVAQRPNLHGLCLSPDQSKAYFVTIRELYVADRNADGTFGEPKQLIKDLPDAGQHPNRTLAFGPDGMLYVSVGSTANSTLERNPENATMLRVSPDGRERTIFARGLRNTIGFAWHPATGGFWGMDHGIDWLGDEDPPEELNLLEQGKHYGWPISYADGRINLQPEPPDGLTREQWKAMSTPAVLTYAAHSAPMQFLFYTAGQFPSEFRNDAFATMRGSWNRATPSGYEVVRLHFENGRPVSIKPFLTGFLIKEGESQWAQFARPVGLAVAKDGSLLVGDDENGVIYRVSYAVPKTASR
ncbi:MAG: hypothetical protein JWM57_3642 [Phycisphaerales bacterium]|nr:hypothetical protein [Phycisphaerales bacterium]